MQAGQEEDPARAHRAPPRASSWARDGRVAVALGSSLAMRSSPHDGFSIAMRRIIGAKDPGKSPICSPTANAICERLIGTIRRECLDWLIPISEAHLRLLLREWGIHYNRSRLHMARTGCARSIRSHRAASDSTIPASDRRGPRRASQIDTGWLASRVFPRANIGLIEYLRSTGLTQETS